MQVKKFEARTMKEALEMVKSQLGPDAIILSARDNNRSFGLVGEGSVEITAAVSEETLHKKRFAESRLREQDRQTFSKSPAKTQKEIIQKMVDRHVEKNQPRPAPTGRRYVDIEDDFSQADVSKAQSRSAQSGANQLRAAATQAAARNARANVAAELENEAAARRAQGTRYADTPRPMNEAPSAPSPSAMKPAVEAVEIQALKGEIASLRDIISKFQDVAPQRGTHPGADFGIPYDLSFMFEKLCTAGVAADIAADILTRAQEHIPALKIKNRNLVEGWVARHVLETTSVTGPRPTDKVHVFVGPAGSGKTSAMIKMASHLVVRERKKVALFTTDTYKVGAIDQMRIYAQILNVPFAVIRSARDWDNILRYLPQIDAVLVDTPGFSLKGAEDIERLKSLVPPASMNPRVHFVASSTSKDGDVTEAARRFSVVGFDDAIFTGLDESVQHGTIYNFVRRFNAPLHSFSIGPKVPEDYEPASRERMLDLIFGITKHKNQMADVI